MNMLPFLESNFEREHRQLIEAFHRQKENNLEKIQLFRSIINNFYTENRRSFAWRENISAYAVVVSEIMLQQTQTERVAQKFTPFMNFFPNFASLAQAPFSEVLRHWKGLGYNRRAIALQKIAILVKEHYNNELPMTPEILESFPGIGKATARSIVAFAFNHPSVFIETNIRTVFICFFFKDRIDIHDKEISPLVEQTLDKKNPREWYYALMDYGVWLKKNVGNLSRFSAHYSKQSKFEGSDRQIRGKILQALLEKPHISKALLFEQINSDEDRVQKIITDLCFEGYIKINAEILTLA